MYNCAYGNIIKTLLENGVFLCEKIVKSTLEALHVENFVI